MSRLRNRNDAKGKLNELMLGWSLAGNTWPAHFRVEGMDPESTAVACLELLGDEEYLRIATDAHAMVDVLTTTLHADGLLANTTDVWNVHWTSNDDSVGSIGDHEMLTGVKDLNSDADIMFQTVSTSEFVGVSAKYGTSRHTSIRNPGIGWIASRLGIVEEVDRLVTSHEEALRDLGWTGTHQENHERFKSDRSSPESLAAIELSLEKRKHAARLIETALLRLDDWNLREFVRDVVAPITVHTHYRTHSRPTRTGTDHTVQHSQEAAVLALNRFDRVWVEFSRGICVVVKGHNVEFDDEETLLVLQVKNQSGPVKGWCGNVRAPMLKEKRRARRVLHAFDLDDTLFWYEDEEAAKVDVVDTDGNVVDRLSPSRYNGYVMPEGCRYSYEEFMDPDLFLRTARPIHRMLDRLNRLVAAGKDVVIVTARHNFRDKDRLLDGLGRWIHDVSKVHLHRSGRDKLPGDSTADAKRKTFVRILTEGRYDEVHFWDDDERNLERVRSIEEELPVRVHANKVTFNRRKGTVLVRKWK